MAVIGGFRSDLSRTRETDGNFGNVSVGFVFQRKRWKTEINYTRTELMEYANEHRPQNRGN